MSVEQDALLATGRGGQGRRVRSNAHPALQHQASPPGVTLRSRPAPNGDDFSPGQRRSSPDVTLQRAHCPEAASRVHEH